MKEWMAQADPSKEARMFVRMNGRLELLSSNKRTHFLKTVESYKLYCLILRLKIILPSQKFGASNISSLP